MPSKPLQKEGQDLPNESDKIIVSDIKTEMEASYLDYAMSVITARALPDVRDGLKPVHRRILYAMNGLGLKSNTKTRKSAAITGEVLGKYHPHGNVAVYEAMVKLAQPFATRYPLVIGQGNFGSIDGDPPAAERYTEAKLSKLAEYVLADLDKETILFIPNYENTLKEPSVLPGLSPNILLNGTLGIAVGMATNIPPHNLKEVCDAAIHLIENEDATIDDLLQHVKGPDFPLGANAYDIDAIKKALCGGRGGVLVRGDVEIVEDKKYSSIIITSIPYRVNKSDLIIKIGELVSNKKIEGIRDLRDESTNDIRIVIELKANINTQKIINSLYKHTQLEETFHYNIVALADGIPKTLNLKEILLIYIEHRRTVVERRVRFDLNKLKGREHILEGLSKALDDIDKIITLIKKSKDTSIAKEGLIKSFKFSELQALAILDMKLSRLAGLERKKIEDELKEVKDKIKKLEGILKTKKTIDKEMIKEISEFKTLFGDDRRTKIHKNAPGVISEEDLIQNDKCVLMITEGGYIKRSSPNEYRQQKRGGVGTKSAEVKAEDFINIAASAETHDTIFFLTDKGKIYKLKAYEIEEGKRTSKGRAIINYISIDSSERVTSIVPVSKDVEKNGSLVFVTKDGTVKKILLKQFDNIRKNGILAVSLQKNDKLISTLLVEDKDSIFIATKNGKSIRFNVSSIRSSGRTAKGVKGIALKDNDEVISALNIPTNKDGFGIMTISENGFGKKTSVDEFKIQNKGGSGINAAEINKKTGNLVNAHLVEKDSESDIVLMSKLGNLIKIESKGLPSRKRQTQGVSLMTLKKLDKITSTANL